MQVRVLVRDLYSKTLNTLGTGVTYCQGDLNNMDSLEYALTDVDKIVVCAAAPRPDEEGFKDKFLGFAKDNLSGNEKVLGNIKSPEQNSKRSSEGYNESDADIEWERLESVMQLRARLAEQVDFIGMQNLVKAYQNVRHADYGTSQAAKRSLFKFQSRADDFKLFTIEDSESDNFASETVVDENEFMSQANSSLHSSGPVRAKSISKLEDNYVFDEYADEYEKYAAGLDDFCDMYGNEDDIEYSLESNPASGSLVNSRQRPTVKAQIQWIRNEFGHGVFVGKVPRTSSTGGGGEAAIISSRLRSRDGEAGEGIDLGGFGGFVCRVCSDGGTYEAFIRTAFSGEVIEYVCSFSTASKAPRRGNASRNKFTTLRLPFDSFIPVKQRLGDLKIPKFKGKDCRHIGFRFRSSSIPREIQQKGRGSDMCSFYLGMCQIRKRRRVSLLYLLCDLSLLHFLTY